MRFVARLDMDEYARLTFDLEMGRRPNPLRLKVLDGTPVRIDLGDPSEYHTSIHTSPRDPRMAGVLTVGGQFKVTREDDAP